MTTQAPKLGVWVQYVYLLLDRSASVAQLCEATGFSETTVLEHLATLQQHGLVDMEERDGVAFYRRSAKSLHPPVAAQIPAQVRAPEQTPPPAPPVPSGEAHRPEEVAPEPERDHSSRRKALALLAVISVALVIAVLALQTNGPGTDPSASDPSASDPTASSPSAADPGQQTPTPDTRDGDTDEATAPADASLQLDSATLSGQPLETIPIRGTYVGAQVGTPVRVQRQQDGSWVSFPLPAVTDESGNFSTYVELGSSGTYRLRVVDPERDVVSDVFRLRIG